jgi:hypothetical protein
LRAADADNFIAAVRTAMAEVFVEASAERN